MSSISINETDTENTTQPEQKPLPAQGLRPRTLAPRDPWRLNILIADDSVMDREWIAGHLRSMDEYDAVIDIADSVAQAKTMISTKAYDVVLADYQLSDGYGDQIIGYCNAKTPQSATILVSGHNMSEVSLFGIRAAATAAICKDDLSPSLLETTIRFALANRARIQAPQRANGL